MFVMPFSFPATIANNLMYIPVTLITLYSGVSSSMAKRLTQIIFPLKKMIFINFKTVYLDWRKNETTHMKSAEITKCSL